MLVKYLQIYTISICALGKVVLRVIKNKLLVSMLYLKKSLTLTQCCCANHIRESRQCPAFIIKKKTKALVISRHQ